MFSWIFIVVWFLASVLFFYIKQSGLPYKSEQHRSNVKHISVLFLLWGAAFIIKAVLAFESLESAIDG